MNNKKVKYSKNVPRWIKEAMIEEFCMGWNVVTNEEDLYIEYIFHDEAEGEINLKINNHLYVFDQILRCYSVSQ